MLSSVGPGVSPPALPVLRSVGVVCQAGLTGLGGGSPFCLDNSSPLGGHHGRTDGRGRSSIPSFEDLPQVCGHHAKNPVGNSRQGGWGDALNELSRSMGYVVVPLYPNTQRALNWMVAMRVMCE
ncbi:hypothetical protein BD311DRAFT_745125 [Dichomitus squalens]|uniref:Uncharacterized protein n=1 Tax=Dichomitus squalens TaxID=114155 RepID=A0A4Q9N6U9_9APHY|nr:hypothetical protein BD311DRAFT_745125 [Dichomitus squalens]